MKNRTRTLTLTAILVAITLLFGFTPIGYIQTPFGIVITLMCLRQDPYGRFRADASGV